jgi:hypothetical protein
MRIALKPHPAFPARPVARIHVDVQRSPSGRLDLRYVVQGDLDRIEIPPPGEAGRADDLWQTTCFELFLRPAEGTGYVEFNFSPSGKWAAYSFARHREDMREIALSSPPVVTATIGPRALEANVGLALDTLGTKGACFLNVAAIVQEKGRDRSFWALAHPSGEPDFHDPACFTLKLPPPAQA